MQNAAPRKINVIALFAAFKDDQVRRRITPYRFFTQEGDEHEIATIRRVYQDKVGLALHVHFVVKTRAERYFDIVYDTKAVQWSIAVEIEEHLFFTD
ncbi:hypothetical protein [Cerasicoccus frondis]|uniref:hypothetical protein n=1 Tax=Cerasicoccus frondis TaxID=490090 RepID=UPI002852B439|nr:hypothetical protein [Cerasicoccus frondis]